MFCLKEEGVTISVIFIISEQNFVLKYCSVIEKFNIRQTVYNI